MRTWKIGDYIAAVEFSTGYAVRDGRGPRAFASKPHFIWRAWS